MSRISRRLLSIVVAATFAAIALVPAAAQPVQARDGSTFVSIVNRYRADAGVAPVTLHTVIDQIAIERADQLAAAQQLGHDMEYVKARLADYGICWQKLGEIVAYNARSEDERVERFVYQWYHSDGHRKVMLGVDYTHAGGSYTTASNGYHYAAMIFVKLCGATAPTSSTSTGSFTDISDSIFRNDIVWIANQGITRGCTETKYCPTSRVLRDQMATFLYRAAGLNTASSHYFSDTWGNQHASSINSAKEAGVAVGCTTTKYCPSAAVTREQMASFLARALNLPSTSRDYFWDDDGSMHEEAINRLAAAGISGGCAAGRYCPGAFVTREQMAGFLRRAFD